jgi:TRAP-type C4-dicarboxylate transport system permease small subunit
MESLSNALDRVGRAVAALCCALMFLFLIADIVLRKLSITFLWPIEYNGFLMAFIVFLPLAGITRRREHMAADFFINALGGAVERVLRRVVIPVAVLLFSLGMLYLAWMTVRASWIDEIRSLGPLRTPMWIPHAVMVVALVAMAISAIIDLFRLSAARPASELDAIEKEGA